jgi:hypothetical protein
MPLLLTKIELDKICLALVDKGASGDDKNRPSIELFKRRKTTMAKPDQKETLGAIDLLKRALGLSKMEAPHQEAEKMDPMKERIDAAGFTPEQKALVEELLAAVAAQAAPAQAPAAPEAPAVPVEAAENPEETPEEDQEMNKQYKADLEKRDAEIVELRKAVKTLSEHAENIEIEKKAKELKWLPQSEEETIEILKSAKGDPEILAMLEKINEAAKASPVLEIIGEKQRSDNDPEVRIEKRAAEIMAANSEISLAKAKRQAMTENPDLYKQRLAEQRGD